MARSYLRVGILTVLCLVALRMGVGWHFFKEGVKKLEDPNFSSQYFLRQAKGPYAGVFYGLIPDVYGQERLDKARTLKTWDTYRETVVEALRLEEDDDQRRLAEKVHADWRKQLDAFYRDYGGDIRQYLLEVDRLEVAKQRPGAFELEHQREWIYQRQAELWGQPTGWLSELKAMNLAYQAELYELAADASAAARLPALPMVPEKTWVDASVTWTVLGVGILLLLGLCTRVAAVVGAGFLATVIATQPFWISGTEPTYYQAVELLALLVMATIGAGRWFGLDFFFSWWWEGKQGKADELNA